MGTTLTIDNGLLRQVREKPLESGKPLKQVVNETMQGGLNQLAAAPRKPDVCPRFSFGALAPGVELSMANQLAAGLEDEGAFSQPTRLRRGGLLFLVVDHLENAADGDSRRRAYASVECCGAYSLR